MFYDRHGKVIDTATLETEEQELAKKYIEPNDIVLELGARYGTVSCAINGKLANKKIRYLWNQMNECGRH